MDYFVKIELFIPTNRLGFNHYNFISTFAPIISILLKMRKRFRLIVLMTISLFIGLDDLSAQIPMPGTTEDSVRHYFDSQPAFTIFKDNYLITGFNPNQAINAENADARFQISFKQRITKSVLPFKTYLFITYTQASSWDIYKESAPFRTTDYNPGIGLGKALIKNNELRGFAIFALEHKSNGYGGEDSRDMNWLSAYCQWFVGKRVSLEGKAYIPFYLGEHSKDIFRYHGFLDLGVNYISPNQQFRASAIYSKTTDNAISGNIKLEAGYMISDLYNIYLFGQYYNGYAENLLNHRTYTNHIRVGICFKPDFFSVH